MDHELRDIMARRLRTPCDDFVIHSAEGAHEVWPVPRTSVERARELISQQRNLDVRHRLPGYLPLLLPIMDSLRRTDRFCTSYSSG